MWYFSHLWTVIVLNFFFAFFILIEKLGFFMHKFHSFFNIVSICLLISNLAHSFFFFLSIHTHTRTNTHSWQMGAKETFIGIILLECCFLNERKLLPFIIMLCNHIKAFSIFILIRYFLLYWIIMTNDKIAFMTFRLVQDSKGNSAVLSQYSKI